MIEITDKRLCSGCTACYNVCPHDCILMKADNEGYLYPQVDKENCTDCGVCNKICPIGKKRLANSFDIEAYAVQAKEERIRKESASGGAFSVFAEYILEKNGIVYGGSYNDSFEVVHMGVKNKEDLKKLRNSKYVQSNLGNIFKEIRSHLKEEKFVLFSGTPCQISGLISYLRNYAKSPYLYLVDLVCHGVPTPKLWKNFLLYNESKYGKIKSLSFRDKKYGYAGSTMAINYVNGKSKDADRDTQFFKKLFFDDINTRPSCFKCDFKTVKRESDITVYDCWHVDKVEKAMDDDKGTTWVLIQSEKGKDLFNLVKKNLRTVKANVDLAIALDGIMAVECTKPHPKREEFFKDMNQLSMDEVIKKYFPLTLKKRITYLIKPLFARLGLIKKIKR